MLKTATPRPAARPQAVPPQAVPPQAVAPTGSVEPLYIQVKRHILSHIESGAWGTSTRVPSESEIVKSFGISRMTANRALRELADEGVLVRVAGVGSFVAAPQARAHPLEIRGIADEIRRRGHRHRAQVITLERMRARGALAENFSIEAGGELFYSVIVHFENDRPIQLEDRHVSPALAPDYLTVDFTKTTPFDYLTEVAPLQEAEHVLRAAMPDARTRKLLDMPRDEPCLLMIRRTWTAGRTASVARLHYPASRYELSGRFRP